MGKIALNVRKRFCEKCSLAFRRFVGNIAGVAFGDVENGRL